MVFYNNLLTTCLLLPMAYVVGDIDVFINTPELQTARYTSINVFAGELVAMPGGPTSCINQYTSMLLVHATYGATHCRL